MEDLPGNFLLLPPGRDVSGVDAGTADYLGVYSGVRVAAENCEPRPVPGVGLKPDAVVAALVERPGLKVSEPRAVEVGGLKGLAIAIDLKPGANAGCKVAGVGTIIPLIIGAGPASLEHAQAPGYRTFLYILANGSGGSNVVVEVSDVTQDSRPFNYAPVVGNLRFDPE